MPFNILLQGGLTYGQCKRKELWYHRDTLRLCAALKGQCPDYAQASSVLSSKDNRTVILTRQDFLPDRTADEDLLLTFSSDIFDFEEVFRLV